MSELRSTFERDGFVVLRAFLSADEVAEVRANVDRYIRDVIPTIPKDDAFYEDKNDPATLKQLPRMEQHDGFFEKLLVGSRLESLSAELLDGPVVGRNLQYLCKPPSVGLPTPPHQDGYYYNVTPCVGLTGWLALDYADEENGCLRYVKGSHRLGMRPHARTTTLGFSQGITDFGSDADLLAEVVLTAEPGDLLVHHALTVHRADANTSPTRYRRALGFVYLSAAAKEDREAVEAYRKQLARDWESQGKL